MKKRKMEEAPLEVNVYDWQNISQADYVCTPNSSASGLY
jgi:hypothetical protein